MFGTVIPTLTVVYLNIDDRDHTSSWQRQQFAVPDVTTVRYIMGSGVELKGDDAECMDISMADIYPKEHINAVAMNWNQRYFMVLHNHIRDNSADPEVIDIIVDSEVQGLHWWTWLHRLTSSNILPSSLRQLTLRVQTMRLYDGGDGIVENVHFVDFENGPNSPGKHFTHCTLPINWIKHVAGSLEIAQTDGKMTVDLVKLIITGPVGYYSALPNADYWVDLEAFLGKHFMSLHHIVCIMDDRPTLRRLLGQCMALPRLSIVSVEIQTAEQQHAWVDELQPLFQKYGDKYNFRKILHLHIPYCFLSEALLNAASSNSILIYMHQ